MLAEMVASLSFTLGRMSSLQVLLFGLAIGVWLIGGELLIKWHYVRRGRAWSDEHSYLAFPFKDFDELEWMVGVFIVLLTFALNHAAFAAGR
jgi:hypothetical protein